MNILIVKLSSLGDVLHNLPIVWDIRKQYPDARVDWVIEEAYVELITPLLTAENFKGIDHIIPLSLRRLRKELKSRGWNSILQDIQAQKKQLQTIQYDIVIETQGLLKSALMTAIANKSPKAIVSGIGNRTEDSGYEPLSRLFYTKSIKVPLHYHAVDRSRAVAAGGLGLIVPERDVSPPMFYPQAWIDSLQCFPNPLGLAKNSYVMCFHATARLAKSWSNDNWIATAKELSLRGLIMVFPWGNPKENLISEQLAKEVPHSIVPKAFSIQDAFVINAQAKLVIGVDTGLTHLAAVLGVPTIELYVDSPKWKTEGYWGDKISNLGNTGSPPTVNQVINGFEMINSYDTK
jgi:heptosyltransferase-1